MIEPSGRLSRGSDERERARIRRTIEKLERGSPTEQRIAQDLRRQLDDG